MDSITVRRIRSSNIELSHKKYVDDELNKNTIFRFNQTLDNYLKLSVGNDTVNLLNMIKYKKQIQQKLNFQIQAVIYYKSGILKIITRIMIQNLESL